MQLPLDQLQPQGSTVAELMGDRFPSLETNPIDIRVLMNLRRLLTAIGRNQQGLGFVIRLRSRMPFGVRRHETSSFGTNPDLQQMQWLTAGRIELRVRNTGAGTHQLNLTRLEFPTVAHAVLVGNRAGDDVTEDFHLAMRVHVSQPALSRQIRLLEEQLGVALFDRIKQRIHLTEAGKFFLLKSRQLLCDAEMSVQQTQEQFGGARRTLRLGFLSPFLDDLVAPVAREFQQRHPKSKVSLFDLPPRAQLDRLLAHELDAAILANLDDRDAPRFNVARLSKHRFVAVLPQDHPLALRKTIKLAELKTDHWVSLDNAFFPKRREFLMDACAQAGFVPRITAEMDSLPMIKMEWRFLSAIVRVGGF